VPSHCDRLRTLDLAVNVVSARDARVGRTGRIDRNGETIRMTPEQAERQRRSFAYGNVKIENDSIPWEMISQGGGGIGREMSGRSAFCPVGRVCDA